MFHCLWPAENSKINKLLSLIQNRDGSAQSYSSNQNDLFDMPLSGSPFEIQILLYQRAYQYFQAQHVPTMRKRVQFLVLGSKAYHSFQNRCLQKSDPFQKKREHDLCEHHSAAIAFRRFHRQIHSAVHDRNYN